MKYNFAWKETGEGRNRVLNGPQAMIALAYRVGGETVKKLNKETRKYETVTTPIKWIAESRLDRIIQLGIYATPEEAMRRCEKYLSATLEAMRGIVSFFEVAE